MSSRACISALASTFCTGNSRSTFRSFWLSMFLPSSWNSERSVKTAEDNYYSTLNRQCKRLIWYRSVSYSSVRTHFTLKTSETIANFRKSSRQIYSKLYFHHKCSVVHRSDTEFCASLFMIMLNDFVLLRL